MELTRRGNNKNKPPEGEPANDAVISLFLSEEDEKKLESKTEETKSSRTFYISIAFCVFWTFICVVVVLYLELDKLMPAKTFTADYWKKQKPVVYLIDESSAFYAIVPSETHPNKTIRSLPTDLRDWPHGSAGLGLGVREELLDDAERMRKNKMYERHAFQEFVSEKIGPRRMLPDFRDSWCEAQKQKRPLLPKTSVIICFHNEALSTLQRSLHSVFDRSPRELLREVILVDDASDMEHLGGELEAYLGEHFDSERLQLVRLPERHGLIRSRMAGVRAAVNDSEVLTFLDSHIEATEGWLEPLLEIVQQDEKSIACPMIDSINDTDFHYQFIPDDLVGLMTWRLDFEWHALEGNLREAKPHPWAPHSTPVMAGGLFSVGKEWFKKLGMYDEGMDLWGGENLELSFKAWMCGGRILIAPCSRVGHVFRSWTPYKLSPETITKNNRRAADVWMDEFRFIFYDRMGKHSLPFEDRLPAAGDLESRHELRRSLKCQDFRWYLSHVATSLPFHRIIGAGEISNPSSGLCLDKAEDPTVIPSEPPPVELYPCHGLGGAQYWWLTVDGHLQRDFTCIGVASPSGVIAVTPCEMSGVWSYDAIEGRLRHNSKPAGECLSALATHQGALLVFRQCDNEDDRQLFVLTKYKEAGLEYEELTGPPTEYPFIQSKTLVV